MAEKLSSTQKAALEKLSRTQWKTSYDLQVSLSTLNALVHKGYALKRGANKPGSFFSPRTVIEYIRSSQQ